MRKNHAVTLAGLFWLGLGCSLLAVDDTVYVRDKKTDKVVDVKGDITADTVAGIKLKSGPTVKNFDLQEIVRVTYGDLPKDQRLLYSSIMTAEDRREEETALKEYTGLLPKLKNSPKMSRQVEFRKAVLQAKLASTPEQLTDAAKQLAAYLTAHPDGWQYSIAARQLARIYIADTKYDEALDVLNRLGTMAALPKDVKNEVELLAIDVLIAAAKPADATKRIRDASIGLTAADPMKQRLDLYTIALDTKVKPEDKIPQVEAIINNAADPNLKALGYNIKGDCFMQAKKSRDAMWSYLWVEMVYNQDPSERLKALDRLSKYFEEQNDDERAKVYRDKIAELR
ncbi:YfgM family protein [Tuwongella immobilis]|uniref:Tetratricopeptide repeat protein n=1 Tax=Tuwongella immobilis TaxID=692036 RepID=A0A6C2YPX0_9BACT|nr:hypothetical protein [Tuwongella immobilis]VIP03397.1 secreted protein : Uncharacterized protein OS=Pirellula staleyi (strain ATCC 27377 / DSM 6068 / ICPB 4128) GN=Psta_4185 PE=4 SV=1: TPR_21 [Tuwongella immobilis]VTS04166.1 secreted protein : Uncharacterized protein OS=Pirellula staleyi (strain ATCC 27377 / DSM 6068 / ICPB 4128) GN=Psta_4185 PE=4 SV=1: TPR_21 [Tuwongella immobilis]